MDSTFFNEDRKIPFIIFLLNLVGLQARSIIEKLFSSQDDDKDEDEKKNKDEDENKNEEEDDNAKVEFYLKVGKYKKFKYFLFLFRKNG